MLNNKLCDITKWFMVNRPRLKVIKIKGMFLIEYEDFTGKWNLTLL